MAYCLSRCPSTENTTTYSGVWYVVRDHFGPRPDSMTESYRFDVYEQDVEEYYFWITAHGGVDTLDKFGKWLIWRLSIGTAEYGNLPTHKVNDRTGIQCVPCPYDEIGVSSDDRSEIWLGIIPLTRTAHGDYYMKVASRGSSWGFECTSNSCPYFIETGHRYFHA